MAGYARQAASSLDRVADAVSQQSVDDVVETIEHFARRQPAAFVGGAVLTGFALARFAKSSADRRRAKIAEPRGDTAVQHDTIGSYQTSDVGGHTTSAPSMANREIS